jgi:CheY-like chemotaxis protein
MPAVMALVLIVDDEKDSRDVVARYFRKAGYVTRCAPNGRQALAAIGTEMPDVVILDWMMPEMDGISFLQVLRSYLRWNTLPVVLLTAHQGEHIEAAMKLGVKRVFLKASFTLAELLECVNRLRDDPTSDCASAG